MRLVDAGGVRENKVEGEEGIPIKKNQTAK
jgi:hypothetical protein